MKTIIIYRPNSEHARMVDEFVHQYLRRYQEHKLELLNVDSREGGAIASLYDVMAYPAIVALRNDGSAMMVWQGDSLPLMDEVASYAFN